MPFSFGGTVAAKFPYKETPLVGDRHGLTVLIDSPIMAICQLGARY